MKVLASLMLVMMTAPAWAAPVTGAPLTTVEVSNQTILADRNEMTVYTYDPDGVGVSNCYNHCAKEWPPVLAKAGEDVSAPYSLVKRTDGTEQLAYDSHPLYLYEHDKKSGDDVGDGLGGVWHIVTETTPADDQTAGQSTDPSQN